MITNSSQGPQLSWFKPALATSALYKAGFATATGPIGSHYAAPLAPDSLLQITDGTVTLGGGNLPDSINPVTLNASSKLVNNGTNTLKLTFTASSGLFAGSFLEAGTPKTYAIKGVVLQRQNNGSGYAPGTNQSGSVIFQAAP